MYGKMFGSMYTGSMVGSGALIFAVWGYVIANMVPDRKVGAQVELNPKLLAFVIGEGEEAIAEAIAKLCEPDPHSRTKKMEGRRLVRLGEFDYQVVNGAKYRAIRNEEVRRQQNREAKQRQRERERQGTPLPGEEAFCRAEERGDEHGAEAIVAEGLPPGALAGNGAAATAAAVVPVESRPGHRVIVFKPPGAA